MKHFEYALAILQAVLLYNLCLVVEEAVAQNYSDDAAALSAAVLVNCPNVNPLSYSPSCVLGRSKSPDKCKTTSILLGLWLERFHEIDDIKEAFAFSGSVHFIWNATCPNKFRLWHSDLTIYLLESQFWSPRIYHQNAAYDYGMQSGFVTRFLADGLPNDDSVNSINFYLQRSGVFVSTSDMDFAEFPFDEQTFEILFLVREKIIAVQFAGVDSLDFAKDFMPDGTIWTFVSINYTIAPRYIMGSLRSVFVFELKFKRKPDYYVYNLLLPTCLLSALELGSFLMPPHLPDRPTFAMAILLALTFVEGQILERVPAKPQRVFLTNYTYLCVFFSWVVTLYSLFSNGAVRVSTWKKWFNGHLEFRRPAGLSFNLQRCRIMDIIAFLLSLAFFCGINGFAYEKLKSADYI